MVDWHLSGRENRGSVVWMMYETQKVWKVQEGDFLLLMELELYIIMEIILL